MKKIISYLIILISVNIVNSQELKGYIEYSLTFIEDKELGKGQLADYYKSAIDNSKYVKFILEFNKNEMYFYTTTSEIDGVNVNFSKAFSGVNGSYYRKATENNVLNFIDNPTIGKVIIKKNIKTNWTLHNETKKIQDFICYKASTIIEYNNGVGDFKKNLVVWYCPKIPYSYGPKGYGNLAGLILEFHYDKTVIGAKKIVFNKDIKIKVPMGGRIMTEVEYSDLLDKKINE